MDDHVIFKAMDHWGSPMLYSAVIRRINYNFRARGKSGKGLPTKASCFFFFACLTCWFCLLLSVVLILILVRLIVLVVVQSVLKILKIFWVFHSVPMVVLVITLVTLIPVAVLLESCHIGSLTWAWWLKHVETTAAEQVHLPAMRPKGFFKL